MQKEKDNMKEIILASQSPRRRDLLTLCGLPFLVDASEVDESIREKDPSAVVSELSKRKAHAVFDRHPHAMIIGADTVVAIDQNILGKPADETDAMRMLRLLSDKTHQVYTGVTILYRSADSVVTEDTFFCKTDVTFFDLTEESILSYISSGAAMDKAGAYGIQDRGCLFVRSIRGDYNNVVGLPISMLMQKLTPLLTETPA